MIIFRHIETDMPPDWSPIHWYVEYHDDEHDMAFPLGIAFVSVVPDSAFVDFVLVADKHRRKGVGLALCKAINERWGDKVFYTDAISQGGKFLMKSVNRTVGSVTGGAS